MRTTLLLISALLLTVTTLGSVASDNPTTIVINTPTTNANIATATIVISATATDTDGITSVAMELNGVRFGTMLGAAFLATWDTTRVPNGAYTLVAVAKDALGNETASAPVYLTIDHSTLPRDPLLESKMDALLVAMGSVGNQIIGQSSAIRTDLAAAKTELLAAIAAITPPVVTLPPSLTCSVTSVGRDGKVTLLCPTPTADFGPFATGQSVKVTR